MAALILSRVVQFSIILSIWPNGVFMQSTVPETFDITANSTELPSATTDASTEEPVTYTTFPPETSSQTDSSPPRSLEPVTTEGTTESFMNITTDATTVLTDAATGTNTNPTDTSTETTTVPTDTSSSVCTCNMTPGLCDIGCCCDTTDCGITDLSSVFSGCEGEGRSGVCIESWLMFRGNVDPALITVNDSFFCVRSEEVQPRHRQTLPAFSLLPKIQNSYSFSQQDTPSPSTASTTFYRVDDAILTYFETSSVFGVLRQPSPGAAASSCVDRNPARFLRSISLSCSRIVTVSGCVEDPSLNARSYYSISILKAPVPQNVSMPNFKIPVTVLSESPEPSLQTDTCLNVVSKVEYNIEYTSEGEITKVTLNMNLTNADSNTYLLQEHAVRYSLVTPSPTPGPSPSVGLHTGTPVIGRFSNVVQPLTVQGTSRTGECSTVPNTRTPVLFKHNYVTGCTFSSSSQNCSELQSQLFGILQGSASPDAVAMNSGTQPDWTKVITQTCHDTPMTDSSACLVPVSLSVRLLWAQRGLLSLPQNQILGAKLQFQCQTVKSPLSSPLVVITEVTFSESTVYPEPPRGQPQPQWKFPFGFFSRGKEEQDVTPATNCYSHHGAVWGTLWFITFILVLT